VLELPVIDRIPASDGSGAHARDVEVVHFDNLRLGELSAPGAMGLVLEQSDPERDGALGFPMFADHLLTIDYGARRLRASTGELPPPDGTSVLPFEMRQGLPVIRVRIASRETDVLIDSGCECGLLLPRAMASELPLAAPPQPAGRLATLFREVDLTEAPLRGSAWIGSTELCEPTLRFAEGFNEALLGRRILESLVVTFDQRNKRVQLERAAR
jgi:hypothetical protein